MKGGSWYRFVVTGDVTGGRLKTPADADAESLQAKWISDLAELSLRANDVIPLVDRGRQFAMRRPNDPWYELQVIIMNGSEGCPRVRGVQRTSIHTRTTSKCCGLH